MKILVVSPWPALPLSHGGRVRAFKLAAGMVRAGASVDVLCPWSPGQPRQPFTEAGVRCHPHFFATNLLLTLPDDWLPSVIAVSWQPFALGPRRRLRTAGSYDVIQFELCGYGAWMERLSGQVKVVYSSHNVEADFIKGQVKSAVRGPVRREVAALERRAVATSDLVIACTAPDARRLAELYGDRPRFEVVPNGFDNALHEMDRAVLREQARAEFGIRPHETVLLFIGGGARHNRDAARDLAERVLPQLGPDARLLLVGKCSDGLREHGAVLRLGYVEDIRPVLAAADVALNPVAFGSGSNLKMAEYLAAGLPVVTTPVGARGLALDDGLVRVAELDQFGPAIREVAAGSRGAVAAHRPTAPRALTWDRCAERLVAAYGDLIEV